TLERDSFGQQPFSSFCEIITLRRSHPKILMYLDRYRLILPSELFCTYQDSVADQHFCRSRFLRRSVSANGGSLCSSRGSGRSLFRRLRLALVWLAGRGLGR